MSLFGIEMHRWSFQQAGGQWAHGKIQIEGIDLGVMFINKI